MSEYWPLYFWFTFAFSLYWLLKPKSKLSGFDNLIGSVMCAAFGFILWPFYMAYFFKARGDV